MEEKYKNRCYWYAVYTKGKWERKVELLLCQKGIQTFCPMQVSVRQWTDRRVNILLPVFPSYVFVKIDLKQFAEVRQTPGVVNFVYFDSSPAQIKEAEMEAIRLFISQHQNIKIKVSSLIKGIPIHISSGIFKDQPALVQKIKKNKVILELVNLNIQLEATLEIID